MQVLGRRALIESLTANECELRDYLLLLKKGSL